MNDEYLAQTAWLVGSCHVTVPSHDKSGAPNGAVHGNVRLHVVHQPPPVRYRDCDDWAGALRWSAQRQAQNWAVGWRLAPEYDVRQFDFALDVDPHVRADLLGRELRSGAGLGRALHRKHLSAERMIRLG